MCKRKSQWRKKIRVSLLLIDHEQNHLKNNSTIDDPKQEEAKMLVLLRREYLSDEKDDELSERVAD